MSDETALLKNAGFCLDNTERAQYLKTAYKIGHGSFGVVWEGYRRPTSDQRAQLQKKVNDHMKRGKLLPQLEEDSYVRIALKEVDLGNHADRRRCLKDAAEEATLLNQVRGASHLIYSFTPWYSANYDRLYFPMEMASMDLEYYIRSVWCYKPPPGFLMAICCQMILALQELQERKVIHRDIKLENFLVFIHHEQKPPLIKLADFGLGVSLTKVKTDLEIVGTPYFMAPECYHPFEMNLRSHLNIVPPAQPICSSSVAATVAHARDIWALGCCFYAMANGEVPFRGSTREEVHRVACHGRSILPNSPKIMDKEKQLIHSFALCCLEVETSRRATLSQLRKWCSDPVSFFEGESTAHQIMVEHMRMEQTAQLPSLRVYQLMGLCRKGFQLPIFSRKPENGVKLLGPGPGEVEGLGGPCGQLVYGHYVLVDQEFVVELQNSPDMKRADSSCPVIKQGWARIVYPCRGFCPTEQQGHHVLHPFHCRHQKCAPLPSPLPLSEYLRRMQVEKQGGDRAKEVSADHSFTLGECSTVGPKTSAQDVLMKTCLSETDGDNAVNTEVSPSIPMKTTIESISKAKPGKKGFFTRLFTTG